MDTAYDHLQDNVPANDNSQAAPPKDSSTETPKQDQPSKPEDAQNPQESQPTLNSELQDAYKAFQSSPWGARLGGFFGNVVKQGESVYTQASKELAEVGDDASKGFNDIRTSLLSQTRNLSIRDVLEVSGPDPQNSAAADEATKSKDASADTSTEESETMLSRLRAEATKRLKDLQRAEDAADEALLRFGGNVRDFLKEAVSIAPPDGSDQGNTVLFESKDAKGKRVIHTSRFDAQLHVIHTSTEGFTKDPTGAEYEQWCNDFDVEKRTEDIATDLAKYPDLRVTMEKLVPDQIPYADFWKRYYYLRHSIETAEARRRDLLKAASAEDEVGWGDDSDDEESPAPESKDSKKAASVASSTTIHPPTKNSLKPTESRQSHDEKSQADSEGSYDVVGAASGNPSQAPNSPKESKKADDSDDDWE